MTATSTASVIACRHVWKIFGSAAASVTALQDVSLEVLDGEFVTLVGASGCGKSTLLRTIAGLETHSAGEIEVDGEPVAGPGVDRAMVFQNYSLYPWLTVMGNIKFTRELAAHTRDRTSADVEAALGRAETLLRVMGLTAVARAYPNPLSGGM
jgi:NitT/TauT family transport system ATP-binding protein